MSEKGQQRANHQWQHPLAMNVDTQAAPRSTDELAGLDGFSFEVRHVQNAAGSTATAFLHLSRGMVRDLAYEPASTSPTERPCPPIVTMMGGTSRASGQRIDAPLNGPCTYRRLCEDLKRAQQSVAVQWYYGAQGHTGVTLQQVLIDRARAGARVCVLYDAVGALYLPESQRQALRAGGVIVESFRPVRLSTLHLAENHLYARGVVIDSDIGWTGGFGPDGRWLGDGCSYGSWRETNLRFAGCPFRELQAAVAAAAWSTAVAPRETDCP